MLVEHCIVCDNKIATDYTLLRSTTCSRACSRQLRKSQLLVRLPELIKDFEAVKLHFFAVADAIRTGKLHVPLGSLPPMPLTEMMDHGFRVWERFSQPINAANSIESWVANLGPRTELFMAWVLTSYRGVLITIPLELYPTLDCAILVASANPQAEAAFAKKLLPTGGKSQPVFHGTTTDRLQSILHIGLQTQTKPNMRWGNVLGDGIYTTDTSEVALRYAQPQPEDANYSRCVLLICELAEPAKHKKSDIDPLSRQACQVYVTTEPDDLILRVVVYTNPGIKLPPLPWAEAHKLIRLTKQ